VVLALIDTGLTNVACCQPDPLSPVKVTDASLVPEALHRWLVATQACQLELSDPGEFSCADEVVAEITHELLE